MCGCSSSSSSSGGKRRFDFRFESDSPSASYSSRHHFSKPDYNHNKGNTPHIYIYRKREWLSERPAPRIRPPFPSRPFASHLRSSAPRHSTATCDTAVRPVRVRVASSAMLTPLLLFGVDTAAASASLSSSTYLLWYLLYAGLFALFYIFSSPFTGNRSARQHRKDKHHTTTPTLAKRAYLIRC